VDLPSEFRSNDGKQKATRKELERSNDASTHLNRQTTTEWTIWRDSLSLHAQMTRSKGGWLKCWT
jgi:hypothetical protein